MINVNAETIKLSNSGGDEILITLPNKKFKKIMKDIENEVAEHIEIASTDIFKLKEVVQIDYDSGPSEDPMFIFYLNDKNKTRLGSIKAKVLKINDDGSILAFGHTNNMFSSSKKYTLVENKIKEVQQPFLSVGIKSKALTHAEARDSQEKNSKVIFKIKQGEVYDVLISDLSEKNYLIKSPEGLLGWVSIESTQNPTLFNEIRFFGD